MKLVALYKDPKKRRVQRAEMALLAVVLPLALILGVRSLQTWSRFRQADSLYVQAEGLLHQNRPAQSIPLLENALKIYPEFLPAWKTLGISYHLSGELKKELETYQRAVSVFPEEHEFHRDLAMAYHLNGDHKSELEHLEIAARLPMDDEKFLASLLRRARAEAAGTYPKSQQFRVENPR